MPLEIAAKVQFLSDRTCCVCRVKGKPVQIHHIDENPSNNEVQNLAVLCLDCHTETQISGGFHRKLDAEQVTLYRDDWIALVAKNRASSIVRVTSRAQSESAAATRMKLITGLAELYRELKQYSLLASLYQDVGNKKLRDKYIALALSRKPSPGTLIRLRRLQGKFDSVPKKIIQKRIAELTKSKMWCDLAWLYMDLKDYRNATLSYCKEISRSIQEHNEFTAAFYSREFGQSKLDEKLYEIALAKSATKRDLFWQIRALEELGWTSEVRELIASNKSKIAKSKEKHLKMKLAEFAGNVDEQLQLTKEMLAEQDQLTKNLEKPKD